MAHFFEAYLPASWQVEAFSKYPPTKCRREKAEQWSRFWDEVHNEATTMRPTTSRPTIARPTAGSCYQLKSGFCPQVPIGE